MMACLGGSERAEPWLPGRGGSRGAGRHGEATRGPREPRLEAPAGAALSRRRGRRWLGCNNCFAAASLTPRYSSLQPQSCWKLQEIVWGHSHSNNEEFQQ